MATVTAKIDADAATVFAVLAEGWALQQLGSRHVAHAGCREFLARGRQQALPRLGDMAARRARRDRSEECEPNRSLTLSARGRPIGEARVVIELAPEGGGTVVTLHETPIAGPAKWLNNPVTEAVIARRNVEALARLKALVERHTSPLTKQDRLDPIDPEVVIGAGHNGYSRRTCSPMPGGM